jgi:exopolyphosphatase / guanosine-5'-triphosphate,3'-diphosphate pyrophosphatase
MRVAAIDIGTNSVHLVVADVRADGGITVVEKAREQIELGRGGLDRHLITADAMDRAVATLQSFHQTMSLLGVEAISAAATSAVREAQNGNELCDRIAESTGIHVQVISGIDEARYIWLGARKSLDHRHGTSLLIDIGGGSVELVLGDPTRIRSAHSLPLGHLRMSEQFLRSDPPSVEEIQALRRHVRALLEPVLADPATLQIGATVGTSGSIRTLGRMATLMRGDSPTPHDHGLVLQRAELKKTLGLLVETRSGRLDELAGMDTRRKQTLPAAAAVLYQVMKSLAIEQLSTSESALREGLLYDWIERHRPELALTAIEATPRMRSALYLLNRYGADRTHAEHVRTLALELFDGLSPVHGLDADARGLLECAALLHDIGHHIDARNHHRHGEYLILNSPMPGFTAPEVTFLGSLVRYHRGRPKRTHGTFQTLTRNQQRRVEVLSAILRIADALDRSHHQPVRALRVEVHAADLPGLTRGSTPPHADADRSDIEAPMAVTLHVRAREQAYLERWASERRIAGLAELIGCPTRLDFVMDTGPMSFAPAEGIS